MAAYFHIPGFGIRLAPRKFNPSYWRYGPPWTNVNSLESKYRDRLVELIRQPEHDLAWTLDRNSFNQKLGWSGNEDKKSALELETNQKIIQLAYDTMLRRPGLSAWLVILLGTVFIGAISPYLLAGLIDAVRETDMPIEGAPAERLAGILKNSMALLSLVTPILLVLLGSRGIAEYFAEELVLFTRWQVYVVTFIGVIVAIAVFFQL